MLDVYIRPLKKAQRSSNDPQGIAKLITDLKSLNIELITLEATGGIERLAIEKLQAANLPVAKINPRHRARSKALADIEAHLKYLEEAIAHTQRTSSALI
jgi:transposase